MRYSAGFFAAMLPLLPFHAFLSASHWLYMFGHAGLMHYALNGLGWLFLWRVITPWRTLAAWLVSVGVSFIVPSNHPVIGWSVVIYYYLGLCLSSMDRQSRNRFLLLTLVGFFLPHIAAAHHAAMLAIGFLMRKLEVRWERTLR